MAIPADDLEQLAVEPQTTTTDGQTDIAHNLRDVVALDQYLSAKGVNADESLDPFDFIRSRRAKFGEGC
jgi:hypothetical protein